MTGKPPCGSTSTWLLRLPVAPPRRGTIRRRLDDRYRSGRGRGWILHPAEQGGSDRHQTGTDRHHQHNHGLCHGDRAAVSGHSDLRGTVHRSNRSTTAPCVVQERLNTVPRKMDRVCGGQLGTHPPNDGVLEMKADVEMFVPARLKTRPNSTVTKPERVYVGESTVVFQSYAGSGTTYHYRRLQSNGSTSASKLPTPCPPRRNQPHGTTE